MGNYSFERKYSNDWSLADKSSTIAAKQEHLNKFVMNLENGNKNGDFAEYNAMFLKTPNNSFEQNLKALKTLQDRLLTIQDMAPNSFEYNTAIQQITQQEQGEAEDMMNVFYGCYLLNHYILAWNWISMTIIGGIIIVGCFLLPVTIIILCD